ncbi:lef-4 [Leucania separata nucleopolyhedrovirus]|uniref:Lef-4 n=1 Tax=Leucania separata nucleopolyhedrovirus TaxID=1307956 RepID=Q0IL22_NPVLS|nr:lef-4 [Leucania separata nucleopolyhedrovirus]AAR28861.1 lef-4 [Leucania separata nucleopolyhedrovirus]
MAITIEKEISYTINVSQDLLYIIFDTYIVKNFKLKQEYCDLIDSADVRSRIPFGDGRIVVDDQQRRGAFVSVKKTVSSLEKFVYIKDNYAIPLINRKSVEQEDNSPAKELKRIVQCRVYGHHENDCPVEIKFEQTYLNRNYIDKFDSLMGSKQMTLFNLLKNKNETLMKNSHLGSDEVMANMRIECEYGEGDRPGEDAMKRFARIVCDMDALCAYQNISPQLAHTTLLNSIVYRKFERERLITELCANGSDVYRWSLKLDGVRGRGYFTRNFIIVLMDDMRIYAGDVESPFGMNNIVAFQCEMLDEVLYVTDLLHVFKYGYNNRTQYECLLEPYHIDVKSALRCMNRFSERNAEFSFRSVCNTKPIRVRFQRFHKPPIREGGYTTLPTDGFIVIDRDYKYVKYKHIKTVEVEYDAATNGFIKLDGPVRCGSVKLADETIELIGGKIYEAAIDRDTLFVIKMRPDRLVPN